MSNQDDFISPEEIQAKANSAKIRRFIGSIGWQCVVLMTVVYAMIFSNDLALSALNVYIWIIGIAFVSYFLVIIKPLDKLAMAKSLNKNHPMLSNTPSAVIITAVSTAFSVIEVVLLLSNEFFFMAAIWGGTEIFQYLAAYRLKQAIEHVPTELIDAVERQFNQNPEFGEKVTADLAEFRLELEIIDKLADHIENDADLDSEIRVKALVDLAAERERMIKAIEDCITKAALETIKGQDLKKK